MPAALPLSYAVRVERVLGCEAGGLPFPVGAAQSLAHGPISLKGWTAELESANPRVTTSWLDHFAFVHSSMGWIRTSVCGVKGRRASAALPWIVSFPRLGSNKDFRSQNPLACQLADKGVEAGGVEPPSVAYRATALNRCATPP